MSSFNVKYGIISIFKFNSNFERSYVVVFCFISFLNVFFF